MKERDHVSGEENPPRLNGSRPEWSLTQEAFDKLLARLADDRERAGEKYQELRGNLIRFFEFHGSAFPEDNADVAINRVARKIDEGAEVRVPIYVATLSDAARTTPTAIEPGLIEVSATVTLVAEVI